jgi:Protein of unknown function (DUF3500)
MNWKAICFLLIACLTTPAVWATAQEKSNDRDLTRSDFVSDASHIVGTFIPADTDYSPDSMAAAGNAFADSLSGDLLKRGVLEPGDPERKEWTNLPPRPDAGGVRLGELNAEQLKSACNLMAAILSKSGYQKMCEIMLGDDQLLNGGRARSGFGTEQFSIMVFGSPSATEPWAVQLDGHHIGLNVSIHGAAVGLSPSFIGAQPESFEIAGRTYRPYAGETDDAYALVATLSDDQRRQAVVSPKRGFIRTGPGADGEALNPEGVECGGFDEAQKEKLKKLIWNWVGILPPAQADQRMEQVMGELDKMRFSWNGATDPRSDVSWTIQSPTLIIEFSCQEMGGNPLNHLHSMYRDPTAEYGRQIELK